MMSMLMEGHKASIQVKDDLWHGKMPTDDGWTWLYRLVDILAPKGSFQRRALCRYMYPTKLEEQGAGRLYRWLGVVSFGRIIPTGGSVIRRWTRTRMKPYTLASTSIRSARDFYFRACVFEALHLPFFVVLVLLAIQRASIGRWDFALENTILNLFVNLYPMMHHRNTRLRIKRCLEKRAHSVKST